jgi:hypothetical protein
MGVNRPSVKSPRPDHGQKNSRHAQSCREKARKEVWGNREREKRARATRIVEENWRNSENTGSFEYRRRRVTFVLDYFFVSGEGE